MGKRSPGRNKEKRRLRRLRKDKETMGIILKRNFLLTLCSKLDVSVQFNLDQVIYEI